MTNRYQSAGGSLRTRIATTALVVLVVGAVGACSSAETSDASEQSESTAAAPDLTGVWETVDDSNFSQRAVIADSTITISWLPEGGGDLMLYWAGSFEAPRSAGSSMVTSTNDHSQTDSALMSSDADTKDFTYEGGAISYEVSALGATRTVTLKQSSTTIPGGTEAEAAAPESAGHAEVVESGMGVAGDYAWVSAMVTHEGLTGKFATVLFNLYDTDDNLIASEEQVEQFSTLGTTFPIGTLVEIPSGSKAARVDATVSVSEHGTSDDPMPVVDPVKAPADEPRFQVDNPTGADWKNPRISIVCRDDAGSIAGGGVDFPNTIPAGGQYLVSAHVTTGDGATTCEAYVQLEP